MKHLLIASAVAAAGSLPAWDAAVAQQKPDLRIRVGLGAQLRPEFIGAKDRSVGPLWDVDVASGTEPFRFEAPDDSFGIILFKSGGFSFGPAANLQGTRKESDVGAPVGKVSTTIEAGAFAQMQLGDSVRMRGELREGVNGHEGLVGDLGADYIWRDGDRYVLSLGPRVLFSDARYQRAYFGVTPAVALATGLPAFDPDGGVHAVAATGGMSFQFGPRWGLFGFARYERLVGEAARSPIVRQFGSRNQMSAGIGLSYMFNIRR